MLQEFLFKSFLEDGENIEHVVHKHFLCGLPAMLRVGAVGVLLPVAIWYLFPQTWAAMLIWGWLGVLGVKYKFFDWYYDAWVVTNVSLLQIEWNGFFDKSARRFEYHHIMSIGFEMKGVFKTIVNMGNVALQRGTGEMEYMQNIFRPKKTSELLSVYGEDFKLEKNLRDHDSLKDMMAEMLQHHSSKKEMKMRMDRKTKR
jgi:hypothetical protein